MLELILNGTTMTMNDLRRRSGRKRDPINEVIFDEFVVFFFFFWQRGKTPSRVWNSQIDSEVRNNQPLGV